MRALVTGADGFVGGYLTSFLELSGFDVFTGVYQHQPLDDKESFLDIRQRDQCEELIEQVRPDAIFHLAAQSSAAVSWQNPVDTFQTNTIGALNLLESVKSIAPSCRVILIGSSEEYGEPSQVNIAINEEHRVSPSNPYAISKLAQSLIGAVYNQAYAMDILRVRAFNHFGPGQSERFVVSDFAKRIALMEAGMLEPILKVGNLSAKRDFTDVRDVVKAYFLLSSRGISGELYNVGSGVSYSIREILDKLLALTPVRVRVVIDEARFRPIDVAEIICDNSKLIGVTSWQPSYVLEESLRDVLDYWRKRTPV